MWSHQSPPLSEPKHMNGNEMVAACRADTPTDTPNYPTLDAFGSALKLCAEINATP